LAGSADQPSHVTVVCALIECAGCVLAAKRGGGKARAGRWEFPGGKVHHGESAEQALIREIREELGCVVRPLCKLSRVEHRYPDIAVTLLPFVCRLVEGTPNTIEHAELRWVDRTGVYSLEWSDADLPIANEYFAAKR
jgi:8-oxo-dGTP diphosphatase